MTFVRKYLILILITAILAYCVNSKIDERRIEIIKEIQARENIENQETKIAQVVKAFDATYDWLSSIESRDVGKQIFSIELEHLWGTEKPVVFPGRISDIAPFDDSLYFVTVNQSFSTVNLLSNVVLKLKCEKNIVDAFLLENKDLNEDFGFNNNVIVIATFHKYTKNDAGKNIVWGTCNGFVRDIKIRLDTKSLYDILSKSD